MAICWSRTPIDLKMFGIGKHNGHFQPGLDYWRYKTDEQRMEHAQAEFLAAFEREKMAYSECQLLSYIAGFLIGLYEALADQEMQGDARLQEVCQQTHGYVWNEKEEDENFLFSNTIAKETKVNA